MNATATTLAATGLSVDDAKRLCAESMHLMATGDLADFERDGAP